MLRSHRKCHHGQTPRGFYLKIVREKSLPHVSFECIVGVNLYRARCKNERCIGITKGRRSPCFRVSVEVRSCFLSVRFWHVQVLFPPQIALTTYSGVPSEGWRAGGSLGSTGSPQNITSLSKYLRWPWWEWTWEIPLWREVFMLQITKHRASICFYITPGGNSSTNLDRRDEKCWGCSKFSHCWFNLPSGLDFHNQCV